MNFDYLCVIQMAKKRAWKAVRNHTPKPMLVYSRGPKFPRPGPNTTIGRN